jgi:hypothetical protein
LLKRGHIDEVYAKIGVGKESGKKISIFLF